MRIAHMASIMFSQFMSFLLFTGGMGGVQEKCTLSTLLLQKCSCPWGGGVSGKVHSEHIVATKVLMPMGGGMSGKVHSEHIVATKVLMPMGEGGCPGKCTLSTLLLQKCSCPWGRGGVQESALWAHCCYKSAHAHGGGGCLEKCTLSTLLLPVWGMQSIFELPPCSNNQFNIKYFQWKTRR